MKTEIWAHRGASRDVPENTMAAFEKACADGADGLEIDVQRTKDGELVVFHDEQLERLTGDPRQLKDLTRKELHALRVAGAHDIPLFSDVLAFCKERKLRLNIELKNSVHLYPGLEEQAAELVRAAGIPADRIIYSSFHHPSMRKMKTIVPEASVGLLYAGILYAPWNYAKALGADAVITNVPAHAVRLRESFRKDPAACRPVLKELGLEG